MKSSSGFRDGVREWGSKIAFGAQVWKDDNATQMPS